ncbi:uncharacterized protein [Musca autumnalis]|uniref:uncharacterized protein n=1 Tax=Musca autumnalis TaxID=221902 RepID=UPI003CEEE2F0
MRWRGNGDLTSANGNKIIYSGKDDKSESGVGFIISNNMQKSLHSYNPVNDRIITARFYSHIKKFVTKKYVPTEEAEESAKNMFYEQLTTTINGIANRDLLILLGDFNAKIGCENEGLSHIMGKHGMGTRNDNGERLVEFCQATQLVIGGSLFPHKRIHKYTWTSPDGKTQNQIDHICIRKSWRSSLLDVRTKRSADIDSDHELVMATLKVKLKCVRNNNTQRTQRRFDLKLLKNEEKRLEIANNLRAHTPPNNITSWEEACNKLKNIAITHVGYTKKSERKEWISDDTWSLIQERNRIKQQALGDVSKKDRYKTVAKMVKRSARNDKRIYAEAMAKEAEAAAGSNNMKELYKIIKRYTNNSQIRSQPIRDMNGKLLTNAEEQTKRWKQHFEKRCFMDIDGGVEEDVNSKLNKARSAFGRLSKTWRTQHLSLKQNCAYSTHA